MRALPLGIAVAFGLVLAAACGPGNATGPGAVVAAPTDPDAGLVASSADASVADDPGKKIPVVDSAVPAKLCGCSLCQPVISDDACSTDADCAPSALCHAEACIAKAKAPQRTKDTMCTLSLMCATTDANQCGCLAGKCALSARAGDK